MYYDQAVPVPEVKGKIITKKKGDAYYILFQYGQKYNPEKRYTIPERTIIGKQHPTDVGLMFPNEKFQEYFPDVVIPEVLPEAYRSCCLRIGSYVVIQYVLDEYKLPAMLKRYFKDDIGLLLDLVSYLIVDEENAGQYYPDFAFCHPLFTEGMRIYSDSKVCRFLHSVTREQTIGFLDDWNSKRDHKQRIYLSYDSSNKNCQAGDIDLVEFGKAKDDKGTPIFNLAIAFDKNNRVPLFYEEYLGSITDVSQFVYMVDKVKEYGYKDIGFILDRGYFSQENIQYMEDNGYAFIIMVKGRKELVSSLIEDNLGAFETKRSCSIRAYRVYGMTVTARLFENDTKDRYFHIYFNPSKQAAEREHLEQTWDKMTTFLDKHLGDVLTLSKTYHYYYELKFDKEGHLLSYRERADVAERELNLCGYFCIITSEQMTASQALIHYKGRDISEKLFCSDKSFIGSKSMRVRYGESLSAKIFIEFIALIVRNRIYNLLKEAMLRMESKYNYMTVPAALRELEKIEMVRRNKGQYRLDHAVTKKQKVILSSFGLSDADIKGAAEDIGKKLVNNQSLLDEAQEDDMEDNEDGTGTIDLFD